MALTDPLNPAQREAVRHRGAAARPGRGGEREDPGHHLPHRPPDRERGSRPGRSWPSPSPTRPPGRCASGSQRLLGPAGRGDLGLHLPLRLRAHPAAADRAARVQPHASSSTTSDDQRAPRQAGAEGPAASTTSSTTPRRSSPRSAAPRTRALDPDELPQAAYDFFDEHGWPRSTRATSSASRPHNAVDFDDLLAHDRRLLRSDSRRSWRATRSATATSWWTSSRTPTPSSTSSSQLLAAGPPQPLRGGRRRPVHLRLARRRHRATSSTSSRTSPRRRSSSWSRTTAPTREHPPKRPTRS